MLLPRRELTKLYLDASPHLSRASQPLSQPPKIKPRQPRCHKQVAKRLLEFIPPILPGSVIHDNACGTGPMTEAIMGTGVKDITIFATDMVPQVTEQLAKTSAEKGWLVKAEVMPSEALAFPDGTFAHSITNLGIMVMEGASVAAKHIRRTIKDGDLTVLSIWDKPLPVQVVSAAHPGGFNDKNLRAVLESAGFKPETIKLERKYAVLEVKDLCLWASAVWSFLGYPATGWTAEDEEKWDGVIGTMVDWLENYEGYKKLDSGVVAFTMPAYVAITNK
ncbi:uncharacterized protein BDR25DRAFT_359919 [Lindgomyces ingoldianus]|uniref:Uncharacterized protein n=1 Tax=Lindgomyces ingoldianus TaxID=673940 RepID=A0ACB6QGX3_9PLEO|nr:uncharacterized protein BDR25DRAFT_359919 [Lindgomyces ingoldianus]KAF2466136.1 hypothetical protein BDR25DRAFT_359919 [Lindgomyces ingoldianus]